MERIFSRAAHGADYLYDITGNGMLEGGAANDTLIAGAGNDLLVGGTGNDYITRGQGADVIVFNRGDGADVITAATDLRRYLSLGEGIDYEDVSLRRSWDDLVVELGEGESITLQSWYSSAANRSVANLQMIAEAMESFTPGGRTPCVIRKWSGSISPASWLHSIPLERITPRSPHGR